MWKVSSPNGQITVVLEIQNNKLYYSIYKNDNVLINPSLMGISSNLEDFSTDLTFHKQDFSSVDETYSIPAGRKKEYHNHAITSSVHFYKNKFSFIIHLAAYDDGAAFRYEIPMAQGDDVFFVNDELTQFNVNPQYNKMWLQDLTPSYEGPYNLLTWSDELKEQRFGMPAMLYDENNQEWMLINEANIINTNGGYCSCHLVGLGDSKMKIAFAPEEKGNPLSLKLPFTSPWRAFSIENSLDGIVNNTINYNLNPPSVIEDVSWIKPARALWAWWEYENGAQLYSESKSYVDFAASMGFEAVTLDCGWDANWVKELCEYAQTKNVQIWIWTGMKRIDTLKKAQELIPLWASWGVAGLKIDFFENDSVHTMYQYHMIAQLMIEYKLMINYHGSTKPMGEGRTWPNFLTAEGIMGLEHYKWSDMPNAAHNCTVPFIRNATGPMDYTPVGLSNKNRNTTPAHQLALTVVFDSGVTHYAMSLYYLEAWGGTRFLRRTLPHYDGVKVLSGYPGDHAIILRHTEDNWLIGMITTRKQTLSFVVDFLPEGEFEAELYEDDGEMIKMKEVKITNGSKLSFDLLQSGGAGIYIAKKICPPKAGICSGYMTEGDDYWGRSAKMTKGSEPVMWNAKEEGLHLVGNADFAMNVPEAKLYTLRFFYSAIESWEVAVTNGIDTVNKKMPATNSNRTFITCEVQLFLQKGVNNVTVKRKSGFVPVIEKIRLINNNPSPVIVLGAEKAILSNGAELIMSNSGQWEAVGLGYTAEMSFEDIYVPEAGKYILCIDYCGGDSRDICARINNSEKIETYLHSTAGWFFPTWNNLEGKELLVELQSGNNTIQLCNPEGRMSHIRGISIKKD